MPKYAVTLADGHTYEVSSDHELSDQEAAQHAQSQMGGSSTPEPDTWWSGFSKSLLDTAKSTGKGILEGLNPISALKDLAGLPQQVATGVSTIAAHPKEAFSSLADAPAAIGSGLESLSDPETGGRAIGNLALGGAMGRVSPSGVARGAGKATSMIGRGVEAIGEATKHPLSYGSVAGAATGHPIAGALTLGAPYAVAGGGRMLQKLGGALEGIGGESEAVAGLDRYMPNRGRLSTEVPGSSFPTSAAPEPLPQSSLSLVDRYMPNTGADAVAPPARTVDTPAARHFPHSMGDVGSDVIAKVKPGMPNEFQELGSRAESENLLHNAPYGEGGIFPSGVGPSERLDSAFEGLESSRPTRGPALTDQQMSDGVRRVWNKGPETMRAKMPDLEMRSPTQLDDAVNGINDSPVDVADDGMPKYTDWAQDMDNIINAAIDENHPDTWRTQERRIKKADRAKYPNTYQTDEPLDIMSMLQASLKPQK